MTRNKPKRRRPRRAPVPEPREEPAVFETEIGAFVLHPDDPPALKYYLFRPTGDEPAEPLRLIRLPDHIGHLVDRGSWLGNWASGNLEIGEQQCSFASLCRKQGEML